MMVYGKFAKRKWHVSLQMTIKNTEFFLDGTKLVIY